jgi:peptidyl-dipeptidase Dcp
MNNPLLSPWNTPFQTVPFSQIRNEHFLPAMEEAIRLTQEEIDNIVKQKEEPTFENTLETLERSGTKLSTIASVFFNLHSAETNEELQKLAEKIAPMLSKHGNDILLNTALFKRIEKVFENAPANLSQEQKRLLDKTHKSFTRNGAWLNKEEKERMRSIDEELSKLKLEFGNHVLAETQRYEKHIEDQNMLKGIPDFALQAAAEEAKRRDLSGWMFTLEYPSYAAIMKYAENRELRKEMMVAFNSKASKGDELDNREILTRIATLRRERAQLLGFSSHAAYILEERMAKSANAVTSFLDDLLEKAKPRAIMELDELRDFAFEMGLKGELEPQDISYYSEKLKQQRFSIDDQALKPYFELDRALHGAFKTAEKLYGITFHLRDEIDVYHEDVHAYEVLGAEGEHVAVLYVDFFPRKGKRGGAWMTSFRDQFVRGGKDYRPHISIVCNFSPPTSTSPSLLTFDEVRTLFHEFGHALHGMLSNVTYASMSGTNVYWDFVELPSQIMENWCYEKECLDLFAKHYKTGESIPVSLIEGIKQSAQFMEATATLRQLGFGFLDIAWHHQKGVGKLPKVDTFEKKILSKTRLLKNPKETLVSSQFSHIFQGGYSAGYYSYKWAEVLDADAFESFQQAGVFDLQTAQRFKVLLSSGNSVDPMDLFVNFKGRKPKPDALLKRAGIA